MYNGKYSANLRIDLVDAPDDYVGTEQNDAAEYWHLVTQYLRRLLESDIADKYVKISISEKKCKLTHTEVEVYTGTSFDLCGKDIQNAGEDSEERETVGNDL